MTADTRRIHGPSKIWLPCKLGYPEIDHCPNCTPPAELRCPEVLGRWVCRTIGKHRVHNDGFGNLWWPEDEVIE